MDKIKVLFLCVHNSARSQMAEAYLKKFGGEKFAPQSAGLEPGVLNPLAVEVMKEDGIDISDNHTKSVFDLAQQGKSFLYVVTVCNAQDSARCPVFPGTHKIINWNFADPANATGNHSEKLAQTRAIRNQIKNAVLKFISQT